jgi:hypothetical protein
VNTASKALSLLQMLTTGNGTEQASRRVPVCGRYRRDSRRITLASDQRFVMWSAYQSHPGMAQGGSERPLMTHNGSGQCRRVAMQQFDAACAENW